MTRLSKARVRSSHAVAGAKLLIPTNTNHAGANPRDRQSQARRIAAPPPPQAVMRSSAGEGSRST